MFFQRKAAAHARCRPGGVHITETTTTAFDWADPHHWRVAGNAKLADLVRSTLGVEPAPELLAIAMVYFVQGILGLSRLGEAATGLPHGHPPSPVFPDSPPL